MIFIRGLFAAAVIASITNEEDDAMGANDGADEDEDEDDMERRAGQGNAVGRGWNEGQDEAVLWLVVLLGDGFVDGLASWVTCKRNHCPLQ